jgi:isocitrate lyase
MTGILNRVVDTFKMTSIEQEEQQYLQDVEAVKKWWSDSRWRYTRRPFTAEQIVQKRGTIKIEYPSNVQSKKLWKLVENRFAVRLPRVF